MIKEYRFGFSYKSLLAYFIQLLPTIIWLTYPPTNNILTQNSTPYPIIETIENGLGILSMLIIVFIVNKKESKHPKSARYLTLAIICITSYYISWVCYYKGYTASWMIITIMAGTPPFYLLFIGLWQNNKIIIPIALLFAMMHIGVTCSNFL